MIVQSLDGVWQLKQLGSDEWVPAAVPGGVHLDLLALSRIPDPFVADNELRVAWVAESDWEYRRTFRLDDADVHAPANAPAPGGFRRELVFDGIDTIADVTLNGKTLGHPNNMFRTWRWDVTDILVAGANEIVVYFHSPVKFAAKMEAQRHLDHPKDSMPGGPYLRKAPCHFGWDWGPKLPNVGLWKSVRLESWETARISDVRLGQKVEVGSKPEKTKAQVSADIRIERPTDARGTSAGAVTRLTATIRVEGPDGLAHNAVRALGPNESIAKLRVEIERPRLWWPNGMGDQPLYRVEIVLSSESGELDRRTYQIGLRTLELRRKPDQWGESFTFVVNGVAVFGKGSNWIPADSFPARVSGADLERLLGAAAAANHNMVRVWGGGAYEDERFYDLCDRLGILVWQDFMFACSVYPLTDAQFVANLRAEVSEQVARLRHRACLALWCGNNEMERGWTAWGWTRPDTKDLREAYLRFFGRTLPAWVAEADAATPYWPSSPSSGKPLDAPIGDRSGDEHEWVVWHGLAPFETYEDRTWRFVSEFGFESLPSMRTIATFAPDPKEWNLGSPLMDLHQKCASGNARILYYMVQHFRLPTEFSSIVYLSQVQHAEAMRVGVEHWRRERARCSGSLYWQLNDCWPVSSWAGIDYYGRWKALHYVSRRFFAPVLLTCSVEAAGVRLSITNDRPAEFRGEIRWSLEGLDGSVVSTGTVAAVAAPAATTVVGFISAADGVATEVDARRLTVLATELWSDGDMVARRVTPFAPDKHLILMPPRLKATVEAAQAAGATVDGGSPNVPSLDANDSTDSPAKPGRGRRAKAATASVAAAAVASAIAPAEAVAPETADLATAPAASPDGEPAPSPAASAPSPAAGDRAVVRLKSAAFARWVELSLEGGDTVFDDNYFDMPGGREFTIGFTLPDGWTLEQANDAIRVRSLIDTYPN